MSRFDNILGIHEQALQLRSQRMDVLAQNLANATTPHYKAKDLDFRRILAEQQGIGLRTTHERHANYLDRRPGDAFIYRIPLNAAANGNTVEEAVEQATFGQAAIQYDATLRFIEKRVSGIRKALKGE